MGQILTGLGRLEGSKTVSSVGVDLPVPVLDDPLDGYGTEDKIAGVMDLGSGVAGRANG